MSDGLEFNPRLGITYLDVLARLFEETVGHRALYIDVDWTRTPGIDLFEKSVPFETGTIDVLSVSVGDPPDDLPTLWKVYKAWLHEGASAQEVSKPAKQ